MLLKTEMSLYKDSGALLALILITIRRVVTPLLFIFLIFSTPVRASDVVSSADDAANKAVSGIMSFTYWPGLNHAPLLCVFTPVQHLSLPADSAQPPFKVLYLSSEENLLTSSCDAIYFGNQSPQQQSDVLEKLQGRPVLSMSEKNLDCTTGASFCLIFGHGRTLFSVNLDSLSRSGVKVNPDVLLLSRKGNP